MVTPKTQFTVLIHGTEKRICGSCRELEPCTSPSTCQHATWDSAQQVCLNCGLTAKRIMLDAAAEKPKPPFKLGSALWAKHVLDSNPEGSVGIERAPKNAEEYVIRRGDKYFTRLADGTEIDGASALQFENNMRYHQKIGTEFGVKFPAPGTSAHARVMLRSMPDKVLRATTKNQNHGDWVEHDSRGFRYRDDEGFNSKSKDIESEFITDWTVTLAPEYADG